MIDRFFAGSPEEMVTALIEYRGLSDDEGQRIWQMIEQAEARSRAVLEELVGEEFAGHLNFDYFLANCSFAWNYWIKAQYCWAHLIRDIRFLQEKHLDKPTQAWAEQLLDRSRRLFSAWHRRDEMTTEGFRRSMITHRDRFIELVRNPPSTKEATNSTLPFDEIRIPGLVGGNTSIVTNVTPLADERIQHSTSRPATTIGG